MAQACEKKKQTCVHTYKYRQTLERHTKHKRQQLTVGWPRGCSWSEGGSLAILQPLLAPFEFGTMLSVLPSPKH